MPKIPDGAYWFEWGVYPSGEVDISNGSRDVLTKVDSELAKRIIDAHNQVLDGIEQHLSIYTLQIKPIKDQ